jgi:DNA-binding PadR family transcriptional regulator
MYAGDPLGQFEFAVMDSVHRGALGSRRTARRVRSLREEPAGDSIMHEALRRCERRGLLQSERDPSGRRYELTPAGRARLKADRRFRSALVGLLLQNPGQLPSAG